MLEKEMLKSIGRTKSSQVRTESPKTHYTVEELCAYEFDAVMNVLDKLDALGEELEGLAAVLRMVRYKNLKFSLIEKAGSPREYNARCIYADETLTDEEFEIAKRITERYLF